MKVADEDGAELATQVALRLENPDDSVRTAALETLPSLRRDDAVHWAAEVGKRLQDP